MDEDIKKIADFYGYENQSHILIEEMAELTQAIIKMYRKKWLADDVEEEVRHIKEEIADVEICLDQIKYLLECDDLDEIKRYKIDRQKRIMEKIIDG